MSCSHLLPAHLFPMGRFYRSIGCVYAFMRLCVCACVYEWEENHSSSFSFTTTRTITPFHRASVEFHAACIYTIIIFSLSSHVLYNLPRVLFSLLPRVSQSLSLSLSLFSHVSCEWRAGRDHEHEL